MDITTISLAVGSGLRDGHIASLEAALRHISDLGFTGAELSAHAVSAIVNGRLYHPQVQRVQAVLRQFPLRYTVHAPNRLNLAFGEPAELQVETLRACLEFCAAIDAPVLVYHSGLQALDAARAGLRALPTEGELAAGREREVAALRTLAPIAADLGVTIAMENGDPHLWEYTLIQAHGYPADELPRYHARLCIPPIIEQLAAIDHPAVGMCLDIGHLHVAAHTVGFDYLQAVHQAAPWVRHIHVNDNFGKLDGGFNNEADRLPFGEGDLHLPPGWGAIPYREVFARLSDYHGILVMEIKPRYIEHLGEALDTLHSLIGEAEQLRM
ncbi:MAG: sugar phosphate isomerase/epimerase [Chloroflexi bacterium]|nr:sugar phosphate isomerase/epimerase [Chloroflexota bacterium]